VCEAPGRGTVPGGRRTRCRASDVCRWGPARGAPPQSAGVRQPFQLGAPAARARARLPCPTPSASSTPSSS